MMNKNNLSAIIIFPILNFLCRLKYDVDLLDAKHFLIAHYEQISTFFHRKELLEISSNRSFENCEYSRVSLSELPIRQIYNDRKPHLLLICESSGYSAHFLSQ